MQSTKRLWWGLAVLVLVSPLGLILPELLRVLAPAWGEWGLAEIESLLGLRSPEGMKRLSDFWSAPVADYSQKSWGGQGSAQTRPGLYFFGILGVGVIGVLSFSLGKC